MLCRLLDFINFQFVHGLCGHKNALSASTLDFDCLLLTACFQQPPSTASNQRRANTHTVYYSEEGTKKIHITQEILYFGPLMALSLEKIVYISGKKKEKLCKADFTIQYLPMTLDECQ